MTGLAFQQEGDTVRLPRPLEEDSQESAGLVRHWLLRKYEGALRTPQGCGGLALRGGRPLGHAEMAKGSPSFLSAQMRSGSCEANSQNFVARCVCV